MTVYRLFIDTCGKFTVIKLQIEIKEVNRNSITFKSKLKTGFKIVKVFHKVAKILFNMCSYKK